MVYIYLFISVILLILSAAGLILIERKQQASIQRRQGPIVVVFGVLQPIVDAIKLICKQVQYSVKVEKNLFIIAPIIGFMVSLLPWQFLLTEDTNIGLHFGFLHIFAITTLNSYSVFLGGWASNNKYSLLGAMRSLAVMLSYEVFFLLTILPIVSYNNDISFQGIASTQYIPNIIGFFPMFIAFFIGILGDTNRAPLDLAEAESELVSGFNVEYSGLLFTLYFLGEYLNILLLSTVIIILFIGTDFFSINPYYLPFLINQWLFYSLVVIISGIIIWVRATLPRVKYDDAIEFSWKYVTIILLNLLIIFLILLFIIDEVSPSVWIFLEFLKVFLIDEQPTLVRLFKLLLPLIIDIIFLIIDILDATAGCTIRWYGSIVSEYIEPCSPETALMLFSSLIIIGSAWYIYAYLYNKRGVLDIIIPIIYFGVCTYLTPFLIIEVD